MDEEREKSLKGEPSPKVSWFSFHYISLGLVVYSFGWYTQCSVAAFSA
jgi:hypothetical protein